MSVSFDRILISPFRVDFLENAHEPVKPVSLPFFYCNLFQIKTYKQIRGTAIGTKFAPPYAVLFMTALEEKILSKVKKKPSVWWRYIDDIFFTWEHGEESLHEFINEINSFNSTIKFTADWSKEKVNFLDIEVTFKNGVLSTDLSVKPTDTHQFLDPTSCHPYHCIKT